MKNYRTLLYMHTKICDLRGSRRIPSSTRLRGNRTLVHSTLTCGTVPQPPTFCSPPPRTCCPAPSCFACSLSFHVTNHNFIVPMYSRVWGGSGGQSL